MVKPFAIFDCLFIGSKLQQKLTDFSHYEVQLFSYLSCLLSVFNGTPSAFWGYTFIKNEFGSPYSNDIEDAINALTSQNLLIVSEGRFFSLTERGNYTLEKYSRMHSNIARFPFLEAACSSVKLMPYGKVKEAIIEEPLLRYANQHEKRRLLTDNQNPAFDLLYEQFEMLKTALDDKYKNLLIPAVVWLEYLSSHKQKASE